MKRYAYYKTGSEIIEYTSFHTSELPEHAELEDGLERIEIELNGSVKRKMVDLDSDPVQLRPMTADEIASYYGPPVVS